MGVLYDPETVVAGWVDQCRERLEKLAERLVSDPDLAGDIVQDAAIAAIRAARADPGKLANVTDPCGWLAGFVRFVALQWLRKARRRARILAENDLEVREVLYPDQQGGREWDVECLCEQMRALSRKCLTPKQLAVVELVLDGKSDSEIALELNVAPNTVRSHRSAAVRRLLQALATNDSRSGGRDIRDRWNWRRRGWSHVMKLLNTGGSMPPTERLAHGRQNVSPRGRRTRTYRFIA